MAKRDNSKAARALAEWSLFNFKRSAVLTVAKNHDIADRTLWRYLAALKDDAELSALFDDAARELFNRAWADDIDGTLAILLDRMKDLALSSDNLPDVSNAFRQVAEIALAKEVLKEDE